MQRGGADVAELLGGSPKALQSPRDLRGTLGRGAASQPLCWHSGTGGSRGSSAPAQGCSCSVPTAVTS